MACDGLRRVVRFSVICCCMLTVGGFFVLTTIARADPANRQTVADAQCMVIGARLSASSDPQQKVPGQMILMYYLGRIDGRSPNADLQRLIKDQMQKMTTSDIQNAASRCGKEFAARGDDIVRIGKSLGKPAQ